MKRNNNIKGEYVFGLGDAPKFSIPEVKLKYVSSKKFLTNTITKSTDAEAILRKLIDKNEIELREQVVVLYLNNANKVIGYYRHTTGGLTSSLIDKRLILATALKSLSTCIILCHNHPSGTLRPSESDIKMTEEIKRAAKQMDIQLLDHIILTKTGYYSFGDEGEMSMNGIQYQKQMKTPITYYGGKQSLLKYLLPLVPPHTIYCEPFFGGGALFFAKPKSEVEVINDLNGEVMNFFIVLKTKFPALQKEVQATLHSRELYKKAMAIYKNPKAYSDIKRAWALWTATNQGFAGLIGSWGFGKTNSKEKAVANKRDDFTKTYEERLRTVQLESNNALKIIARCDSKDTFIYADPPYIGSDMGHYAGYSEKDYRELLNALAKGKSKFLLSSYPSPILNQYIKKYRWKVQKIEKQVAVTKNTEKMKTEMLVFNYDEKICLKSIGVIIDIKGLETKLKRLKFAA